MWFLSAHLILSPALCWWDCDDRVGGCTHDWCLQLLIWCLDLSVLLQVTPCHGQMAKNTSSVTVELPASSRDQAPTSLPPSLLRLCSDSDVGSLEITDCIFSWPVSRDRFPQSFWQDKTRRREGRERRRGLNLSKTSFCYFQGISEQRSAQQPEL